MTSTCPAFTPATAPLFAVRSTRHRYVVRHPDTGVPVDRDEPGLPEGWLEPVLVPETEAHGLAAAMAASTAEPWTLEPEPKPCPNCGRELLVDDLDWVYPNRDFTKWRAGCNEHDFGCGYEVLGATDTEVLQKWNDGAPHEGRTEDFFEAERTVTVKLLASQAATLKFPLVLAGPRAFTVEPLIGQALGVVSISGRHTSQAALMRQGLRALRAHLGPEAAFEVVSYGSVVASQTPSGE